MNGLGQALATGGHDSRDVRTYTPLTSAELPDVKDEQPANTKRLSSKELRTALGAEEYDTVLAGAKLLGALHYVKSGRLGIERGSVYGAVILLPQLARTLKWPKLLTASALKIFGFLVICIALHVGLLTLLSKEEVVVDAFAGQPYLCDFGVGCEQKGSCKGPGGTEYAPGRLYSYDEWMTRNFVKNSMKVVFPDRAEDIDRLVDPGEYGAETYFGRMLCCFIFITALDPELELALNLARLLWYCPSDGVPWIALTSQEPLPKDDCEWWLDHVKVKIGGMPKHWKVLNSIFILIPRVLLYVLTCLTGITFLMETAVIDDVIINACALGFLLQIDNMVLEAFASAEIKCLMERCEDLSIYAGADSRPSGRFEEDDILNTFHYDERMGNYWYSLLINLVPWKFLRVFALTVLGVLRYYHAHCILHQDKDTFHFVSRPVYQPTSDKYTFWNTLSLIFPLELESKPRWTMPENAE